MQIRKATQEDIGTLAQMWHEGWHVAHGAIVDVELVRTRTLPEFTARTAAHLDQTHVALIDGAIVGFFMVEGDELYQFYVSGAHQGRGAARTMMSLAEAVLPRPRAWLGCTVGNNRAAAFYLKCGWQNTGEVVLEMESAQGPLPVRVWRFEKAL
jgi:putative acetyltransferase